MGQSTNPRPLLLGLPGRFWVKTSIEDRGHATPCVVWTGAKSSKGYGSFRSQGRTYQAHRLAYEALMGPIPGGLQLDHLCRVRACVAAGHLEPVTNRENVLRGEGVTAVNAQRTHCQQGHLYDEENTYQNKQGRRACRACHNERNRAYYARRKASELPHEVTR